MNIIFWNTLLANFIIEASIIIVIFLLKRIKHLDKYVQPLIVFAVGVLLYLIFMDFIPELAEEFSGNQLGMMLLIGLGIFYVLELFLHWHHCHDLDHVECSHDISHTDHSSSLMMCNTFLHNLFHGVIIYTSFAVSSGTGILLSIAILIHALPQNVANFIMNHNRMKGVLIAGAGGIIGALMLYPFGDFIIKYKFLILALNTSGLLYISLSDILPSINLNSSVRQKIKYFIFVLLGLAMMFLLQTLVSDNLPAA